jgi:hypothetical protein
VIAPSRSNVSPAYAHYFSVLDRPLTMATAPRTFAIDGAAQLPTSPESEARNACFWRSPNGTARETPTLEELLGKAGRRSPRSPDNSRACWRRRGRSSRDTSWRVRRTQPPPGSRRIVPRTTSELNCLRPRSTTILRNFGSAETSRPTRRMCRAAPAFQAAYPSVSPPRAIPRRSR